MNVQEQNNASEQYNLDSHNQDITQVHDKITNTEEMKNPFKKKQPNTMINNDSDEEMGEASSTNQPSTTTVGRSVNTKEGNTNLANQAGKHADFSSNRRRSTSNGANFSGSGTFNFTGGQNIMGGNNSDVSQVNYNTDPNVEVKRLLDRAYNKLDDDDQELLDDVLIAVRDHAEKQTN
jgi:hypothetical protein